VTRALLLGLLLALAVAAPVAASEEKPTLAELEREVICPTCHTTLELSDAPVADRMRAFIRERIAAGDTKTEIKASLVESFGEGVLAAPPREGFNWLASMLRHLMLDRESWHCRMTPVTHCLSPRSFLARTLQVRARNGRGLMLGHGRPRRQHTSRPTI
jgi:cytochrome c-type biogenesis protein CcmH